MTRNTTKSKPCDDDTGRRRRSARLADLDKDKPKESPKVAKKSVEKSVEKKKKSPSKRSSTASKKEQEEPNNVPSVVVEKGDEEEINVNEKKKESERVSEGNVENLVDLNKDKNEVSIENSVDVNETETAAVAILTQSNGGDALVTNDDISVVNDIPITQNGNGISISNNIIEKSILTTKEISSKEENKLAAEPQTIETATISATV